MCKYANNIKYTVSCKSFCVCTGMKSYILFQGGSGVVIGEKNIGIRANLLKLNN